MKISQILTLVIMVLLPACLSPYLLPSVYLEFAGVVTQGEIVRKREDIRMMGHDRTRHVLEVQYRYTPADSGKPETGTHQVDAALFDRLRVGSPVAVRYSPWRVLRSLHIVAMGSALEQSSWLSRLPHESDNLRVFFDLGAVGLAILVGVLAWRRKTRGWYLAAAFCAVTVCSAVIPFGFVAFPVLSGVWWKSRGQGYGWVLVGSAALAVVVLSRRVPQPPPELVGPSRSATATARQVMLVDHLWSGWDDPGQDIREPFQMVDLEFTPEGAGEPVHVLDRVDFESVSGLREGATLRIVYPVANPRAARIDGGTRGYGGKAVIYILELNFGIAAVLMLVVLPALALVDWGCRRLRGLVPSTSREAMVQRLSQLPPGDPRRKTLEKLLHRDF